MIVNISHCFGGWRLPWSGRQGVDSNQLLLSAIGVKKMERDAPHEGGE